MQIGYTLPGSLLTKYGIERLRIYVQGANLFTITNYKGLDPELQSQPQNGQIVNSTSLVLTRVTIHILLHSYLELTLIFKF